jgi:DNA-binding protein inhibitor ID, other
MKMKAITAVAHSGAAVPTIANGRVSRHRDGENAEIQMYLSKLKDLVPYMPKNRKISKLEVIQNVIDYICDLQNALESHPAVNNFDASVVMSAVADHHQQQMDEQMEQQQHNNHPRQPLGVRPSPNTILTNNSSSNNLNNNNASATPSPTVNQLSVISSNQATTTLPNSGLSQTVRIFFYHLFIFRLGAPSIVRKIIYGNFIVGRRDNFKILSSYFFHKLLLFAYLIHCFHVRIFK